MTTPQADPALAPLLRSVHVNQASDLHVKSGVQPRVRINGELRLVEHAVWDDTTTRSAIVEIMPPVLHQKFDDGKEVDFAVTLDGVRFRVCAFQSLGRSVLVARRVAEGAGSLDDLHLPQAIRSFAAERRGLVLVTGPTGSGKSTTLASLIAIINESRAEHIVTLEDPVEIVHKDRNSTITQREIGVDSATYADGIRSAMRQDPDVLLIGELRDTETARAALSAAETGHLVLSTMHTSDAQETINRFIDLFTGSERQHVRVALAENLKGVVAQRLLQDTSGGRVPCCEVLINSERISNAIADEEKARDIRDMLIEDRQHGMQSFEQALMELVKEGRISIDVAMAAATNPNDLRVALAQAGLLNRTA